MDLTPKQQTSEALRQAETILITTAQHPSVDQAAAVLAAGMILRKFGKKVTALVSDQLPQSLNFLPTKEIDKSLTGLRDFVLKVDLGRAEVDKLKYTVENGKLNIHVTPFKGGFTPGDVTFGYGGFHYDVALVLGVPSRSRLDRVFEQNPGLFDSVPIVNIDFHRSNENYGAVNLIEPNAASLAEILIATAESLETGLIDQQIATIMLAGIMASTDRFTANHTTAKALTVAAQLMAAGADQQQVVKNLFRSGGDNRGKSGGGKPNQPQQTNAPNQTHQPQPVQKVDQPPQPFDQPEAALGFGLPQTNEIKYQAPGSFDQVAESFNPTPPPDNDSDQTPQSE